MRFATSVRNQSTFARSFAAVRGIFEGRSAYFRTFMHYLNNKESD